MNEKEILDDLRNLTMLTGELASVHEESLRKWPYVLFNGVKSVEIKYDLTKLYTQEVGEGYVAYYINIEKPGEPKSECDILTSWVRDMFWKEIEVSVHINDEKYYVNSSKDNNGLNKD